MEFSAGGLLPKSVDLSLAGTGFFENLGHFVVMMLDRNCERTFSFRGPRVRICSRFEQNLHILGPVGKYCYCEGVPVTLHAGIHFGSFD